MMRFLREGESPESTIHKLVNSVLGEPEIWVRWMTKEEAESIRSRRGAGRSGGKGSRD
jgi:hypothetical protein